MMEPFYRAFEERLRGSRELIKERQAVYLSFIEPLKALYSSCPALDLGCGRGEWLEILLENGFEARGVDLDQGMLEVCSTLNLPAEQGEALDTLKRLADESQVLISGLHIAEHMSFECLQQLVAEALRVLKPAGLLILESPNAENLVVGTNNFYFDPTHERPVPHLLLSFLTEHTGFARFKLLRLQEPAALEKAERIALMNVLAGVSPDYAIVAQKAAPAEQMALLIRPSRRNMAWRSICWPNGMTMACKRSSTGSGSSSKRPAHVPGKSKRPSGEASPGPFRPK
ncbi:class I SAM-dependent methyltransferase [Azotobacter sp. CWF10]